MGDPESTTCRQAVIHGERRSRATCRGSSLSNSRYYEERGEVLVGFVWLHAGFPPTHRSVRLSPSWSITASATSGGSISTRKVHFVGVASNNNSPTGAHAGVAHSTHGAWETQEHAVKYRIKAGWRNGRRKGLKILCPVRDVRVRVPLRLPCVFLIPACGGSFGKQDMRPRRRGRSRSGCRASSPPPPEI